MVPLYGEIRKVLLNEAHKSIQKLLLYEAHKSRYFVHPKSTKMCIDMKPYYWWLTMKVDLANCLEACLTFSPIKTKQQRPYEDFN